MDNKSVIESQASDEDAIRNAISLGGDADTLACITGGIAEAFYDGVPQDLAAKAEVVNSGDAESCDTSVIQVFEKQ